MLEKVIIYVLIAFFVFASSIKLFGWQNFIFQTQLGFFKKYGLTRTHMFLVGLIELLGSLCLAVYLFTQIEFWIAMGAGAIFCTSIGALFFHFRFDKFSDAVPAIITGLLSFLLLYFHSQWILQVMPS